MLETIIQNLISGLSKSIASELHHFATAQVQLEPGRPILYNSEQIQGHLEIMQGQEGLGILWVKDSIPPLKNGLELLLSQAWQLFHILKAPDLQIRSKLKGYPIWHVEQICN